MKAFFFIVGAALASFSAMHGFITYEHWRHVGPGQESVLAPAVLAVLSAALAYWAFRRGRLHNSPPDGPPAS